MRKYALLIGVATAMLSSAAWAQSNTITENLNNTGIPRQAPSLGLGQIYGLNPCATGATAGITTPLFGVAGAISNIDRECETRNNAAVVITGLKDERMAREILCTIKEVREAAARIGRPCLGDSRTVSEATHEVARRMGTPDATPPRPTAVATAPASVPPSVPAGIQVAARAPQPPTIRPDAPAFCHAPGLALYLYPECTGGLKPSGSLVANQRVASPPTDGGMSQARASRAAFRRDEHLKPAMRVRPAAHVPSERAGNGESRAPIRQSALPPVPPRQAAEPVACGPRCQRDASLRLQAVQVSIAAELRRRLDAPAVIPSMRYARR